MSPLYRSRLSRSLPILAAAHFAFSGACFAGLIGPIEGLPRDPGWIQQVVEARTSLLATNDPLVRVEALRSDHAPTVMAALALARGGQLDLSLASLTETLARTRHREVAAGVVFLLRDRGPEAHSALESHFRSLGPAADKAFQALPAEVSGAIRVEALKAAEEIGGEDSASLASIAPLAFLPGEDVAVLLQRLRSDWSKPIQAAATEATEIRRLLGLQVEVAIKAVPTGKAIREVAYREGSQAARAALSGARREKAEKRLEELEQLLKHGSRPDPDGDEDAVIPLEGYEMQDLADELVRERAKAVDLAALKGAPAPR